MREDAEIRQFFGTEGSNLNFPKKNSSRIMESSKNVTVFYRLFILK